MNEMIQKGNDVVSAKKEEKKKGIDLYEKIKPAKERVFCPDCHLETSKHLDLCPHCGRRQLFL